MGCGSAIAGRVVVDSVPGLPEGAGQEGRGPPVDEAVAVDAGRRSTWRTPAASSGARPSARSPRSSCRCSSIRTGFPLGSVTAPGPPTRGIPTTSKRCASVRTSACTGTCRTCRTRWSASPGTSTDPCPGRDSARARATPWPVKAEVQSSDIPRRTSADCGQRRAESSLA